MALREAAAVAQQAEELVHEAENVFFEPFARWTALNAEANTRPAVVEGAVIGVAKKGPGRWRARVSAAHALTPTTGARVVVPEARAHDGTGEGEGNRPCGTCGTGDADVFLIFEECTTMYKRVYVFRFRGDARHRSHLVPRVSVWSCVFF